MKISGDLDLLGNRLKNAAVDPRATPPPQPIPGQVYFNTATNLLQVYTGTFWRSSEGIVEDFQTIYVRSNGSDSSGDGSIENPYHTIQRALRNLHGKYVNDTVTIDCQELADFEGFVAHGFRVGPNGSVVIEGNHAFDTPGSCIISSIEVCSGSDLCLKNLRVNPDRGDAILVRAGGVVHNFGVLEIDTSANGIHCTAGRFVAEAEIRIGQNSSPENCLHLEHGGEFIQQEKLWIKTTSRGITAESASFRSSSEIVIDGTGDVGCGLNISNSSVDINATITLSSLKCGIHAKASRFHHTGGLHVTAMSEYVVYLVDTAFSSHLFTLSIMQSPSVVGFFALNSDLRVFGSTINDFTFTSSNPLVKLFHSKGYVNFDGTTITGSGAPASVFALAKGGDLVVMAGGMLKAFNQVLSLIANATCHWIGNCEQGVTAVDTPLFSLSKGGCRLYLEEGRGAKTGTGLNLEVSPNCLVSMDSRWVWGIPDASSAVKVGIQVV